MFSHTFVPGPCTILPIIIAFPSHVNVTPSCFYLYYHIIPIIYPILRFKHVIVTFFFTSSGSLLSNKEK
ncbi:hypothetical protein BC941DRAFT_428713 [Chlamydoabsidia padenii]|nr:hypothetical protein BC941DRAFT_428713 [Chlamydoabsidia padenii]